MERRNTLYYIAAIGTVLVFFVALIALSTCGDAGGTPTASQEQAILDAYRQGYLDGYSKGYSDGFSSGRGPNVAQQSDVAATGGQKDAPPSSPEASGQGTVEPSTQ